MSAVETPNRWAQLADSLQISGQAFIDGRCVDARTGRTFEKRSPVDGRVLAQVAEGDGADVDVAVAAARAAFERGDWARMAPRERKHAMLAYARAIEEARDELAALATLEMGKPIRDALGEINAMVEGISYYAEAIDKRYGEVAPTPHDGLGFVVREPVGVVGAVTPWNYPLNMAAWKLGPALATGNSVVLKPAEQTPLCGIRLVELGFEAGLPAGVLNVVPGFGHTTGAALGRHMDVDALSFTGSTEIGKYFLRYSGESNMKPVSLECGGKSPNAHELPVGPAGRAAGTGRCAPRTAGLAYGPLPQGEVKLPIPIRRSPSPRVVHVGPLEATAPTGHRGALPTGWR